MKICRFSSGIRKTEGVCQPRKLSVKIAVLLSACMLVLLCCGCGGQESSRKSLNQQGMELIGLMAQMAASEEYGAIMGAENPAFENQLRGIASGDYSVPRTIYEMTVPSVGEFLSAIDGEEALDGLPDSLKEFLDAKSASLLLNQLNAREGSSSLALASLYTAEKTFVSSELEQDSIYLYFFEDGYPIAVAFHRGEDDTVKATGVFVLAEGMEEASVGQLEEVFALLGLDCRFRLLEGQEK